MKDEYKPDPQTRTHYLWHLAAMGVIDMTDGQVTDTAWDRLARVGATDPATVVMIDVGCAAEHPNLKGRIDLDRSIDFTAGAQGTRLRTADKDTPRRLFEGLDLSSLKLDEKTKKTRLLLDSVIAELASCPETLRAAGEVEARFASHGTAVAGLVVGGPEELGEDEEPTPGVIPYFGVDPSSRLVSLRTGFEPDPLPFLAALLYAWAQDPAVIVLPRGIPDPEKMPKPLKDFAEVQPEWKNREVMDIKARTADLRATAETLDRSAPRLRASDQTLWPAVIEVMRAISRDVPIVCAAGNSGESQLLFPASLAKTTPGIVAVGAVSGAGLRSGYSSYGPGLTLVAPSDDMALSTRHQHRQPKDQPGSPDPGAEVLPYSGRSLLSTDIAGPFGYEDGETGHYTSFGGTSGAAALVAGVIALLRRAETADSYKAEALDAHALVELLRETARNEMPDDTGEHDLRPDPMNFGDGQDPRPEQFFGAGLIDARAALDRLLR